MRMNVEEEKNLYMVIMIDLINHFDKYFSFGSLSLFFYPALGFFEQGNIDFNFVVQK